MGFEDRDWNRNRAAGARRSVAWSVNAWIIAICVGVFVIDGFLGTVRPGKIFIDRTGLDGSPLPATVSSAVPVGSAMSLDEVARRYSPQIIPVARRIGLAAPSVLVQPLAVGDEVVGLAWFQKARPLESLLHFSTATALRGDSGGGAGLPQLWRFIGFQFLHANLVHLLFNMMGLWFFGPVVERYLGGKRYGAFYLLCGICGAAMYLLLNFLGTKVLHANPSMHLPFLLPNEPTTPLVGASAGVFGVIMAAAFLAPNAEVLVYFIIPMPLRNLAYALVGITLLTLWTQGENAGGEAAHLGGAIAGFWLIRRPQVLHALFDWMGSFDPTSRSRRVRAAKRRGLVSAGEIDRILDKIRRQGLHSLTTDEREALREASRR